MSPLLRCVDLYAGYSGTEVVRGLTFDVEPGEVVALLGPNGAGKTTTILTLFGLLPPLRGTVEMFGEPVPRKKPQVMARRGVALVPDNRALFTQLTARENLTIGFGRSKADVSPALEAFPALGALLNRKVGALSGGEQQMLALARALRGEPKLLLIDELSLGLAPRIVQGLLPVIRRAATERGVGVVLVEQHVHLALAHADRAFVLVHGEVVVQGSAADLLAHPERLEASYLGGAAPEHAAAAKGGHR
jgi:branched-chain amino acid transport system ATP-binding protein